MFDLRRALIWACLVHRNNDNDNTVDYYYTYYNYNSTVDDSGSALCT